MDDGRRQLLLWTASDDGCAREQQADVIGEWRSADWFDDLEVRRGTETVAAAATAVADWIVERERRLRASEASCCCLNRWPPSAAIVTRLQRLAAQDAATSSVLLHLYRRRAAVQLYLTNNGSTVMQTNETTHLSILTEWLILLASFTMKTSCRLIVVYYSIWCR